MIKRIWKTAKDWGLLGNMAWAAIAAGISVLLPFVAKLLPVLKTPVTMAIPVYMLIAMPVFFLTLAVTAIHFYNNTNRIYGKIFGYYRSNLEITCFPYSKNEDGVFIETNIINMEFVITRKDIATIGPYVYYAYEPRAKGGIEEIIRPAVKCWVNGQLSDIDICYLNQCSSGIARVNHKKDKLRITLRATVPFKIGDVLKVELKYEVLGQHAAHCEDLNEHLEMATGKMDYRFKIQKRMSAEMLYAFVKSSSNITAKVIFPENFPWRHLDNFEDIFSLSIGHA